MVGVFFLVGIDRLEEIAAPRGGDIVRQPRTL